MASTITIKARGHHVDAFGHVNHGRYVEFLEGARWAFFDQHSGQGGGVGIAPPPPSCLTCSHFRKKPY